MLNFRKLAIFCSLVAAVFVSTSSGNGDIDARFDEFRALVQEAARNSEKLPPDTIKYYHIDHLNGTAHDFKLLCLKEFETKSKRHGRNTPNHAYKILNEACESYVDNIIETISKYTQAIDWQFNLMLKQGNIIQFLVHKNKLEKTEDGITQTEIDEVKKKYEGMTDHEAKLCVIIHKYDWGILGDYYPGKKPSVAEAKSETPKPGDYVLIEERFNGFKKLLNSKEDNEKLQNGYYKYNQIDRLNEVDLDFKLLCLEYFVESQSASDETNSPDHAYFSLDMACEAYVGKIIKTITKHKKVIVWQFEYMLDQGNIIEFSIHKNNRGITNKQNEINELKKKYEGMTDQEAELWVIIHEYDWGILGDYYPGEKPSDAEEKSKTPPPRDYVLIKDRFNGFIALAQEVDRKAYPPNTNVYFQIDRLNEVKHDFKLLCLKYFETGRALGHDQRNTPYHAYESLDKTCKFYVEKINCAIFIHRGEILRNFKAILEAGKTIEFLAHMNKSKKYGEEKRTEIERLQNEYEKMSDEEAELWIILQSYDEKIIGEYYPAEKTEG